MDDHRANPTSSEMIAQLRRYGFNCWPEQAVVANGNQPLSEVPRSPKGHGPLVFRYILVGIGAVALWTALGALVQPLLAL